MELFLGQSMTSENGSCSSRSKEAFVGGAFIHRAEEIDVHLMKLFGPCGTFPDRGTAENKYLAVNARNFVRKMRFNLNATCNVNSGASKHQLTFRASRTRVFRFAHLHHNHSMPKGSIHAMPNGGTSP